MNEFLSFQSFYTEEEANELYELLDQNGIESKIIKSKELLDPTFIGDDLDKKVFLKIKSEDFPKANYVLDNRIKQNISKLERDYYLFSFNNDDLLEIINHPDEWSRQDFFIAKKILEEREISISEQKIEKIKSDRIRELEKPESGDSSWIMLGYFLALLAGVLGIFFGLAFLISKKILPDGRRIYTYDSKTRKHGRNIVIISCLTFLLVIGKKIL